MLTAIFIITASSMEPSIFNEMQLLIYMVKSTIMTQAAEAAALRPRVMVKWS